MSSYQKRQAVYCGVVPESWRPQRPWDAPPTLEAVEQVAKNLSATEANHLARLMNRMNQRACKPRPDGPRGAGLTINYRREKNEYLRNTGQKRRYWHG